MPRIFEAHTSISRSRFTPTLGFHRLHSLSCCRSSRSTISLDLKCFAPESHLGRAQLSSEVFLSEGIKGSEANKPENRRSAHRGKRFTRKRRQKGLLHSRSSSITQRDSGDSSIFRQVSSVQPSAAVSRHYLDLQFFKPVINEAPGIQGGVVESGIYLTNCTDD